MARSVAESDADVDAHCVSSILDDLQFVLSAEYQLRRRRDESGTGWYGFPLRMEIPVACTAPSDSAAAVPLQEIRDSEAAGVLPVWTPNLAGKVKTPVR